MLYILEGWIHHGGTFRLQKDGSWREISRGDPLLDSDYTTDDPQTIFGLRHNHTVTIGGESLEVNPSLGVHLIADSGKVFFYAPRVLRKDYPPLPNIDQLREVIKAGNDNADNCLILKVDASFELIQLNEDFQIDDPRFVAKLEFFIAHNGYVGSEASANSELIREHYNTLLECWKEHLITGEINMEADTPPTLSTGELIEEISKIGKNWREQY